MKTYTVFFQNEETPQEICDPAGPGTLRFIDGISTGEHDGRPCFSLGYGNVWVPFSKKSPPPIVNESVLACDLKPLGQGKWEVRNPLNDTLLSRTERHDPFLVRIHTQCVEISERDGFIQKLRGDPKTIASTKCQSRNGCFEWTDNLVVMSLNDALHVRPAGTVDLEWVIEYSSVGPTFITLEEFYNR